MNGYHCVCSCGPMMLAMAIDIRAVVLMPSLMVLALVERYRFRPPRRTSAASLAVMALAIVAVG